MCETETEAKNELVEIFKNMTEKDWKNLIEELENAINSEKKHHHLKSPKLQNRHRIRIRKVDAIISLKYEHFINIRFLLNI